MDAREAQSILVDFGGRLASASALAEEAIAAVASLVTLDQRTAAAESRFATVTESLRGAEAQRDTAIREAAQQRADVTTELNAARRAHEATLQEAQRRADDVLAATRGQIDRTLDERDRLAAEWDARAETLRVELQRLDVTIAEKRELLRRLRAGQEG